MKNKKIINKNFLVVIGLTLVASFLFNLVLSIWYDSQSINVLFIKLILLTIITILFAFHLRKINYTVKYGFILICLSITNILIYYLINTKFYDQIFNSSSFFDVIGGNILTKLITALIITALLLIVFKNKRDSYLNLGDLSVKAEKITWLGIEEGKITWKKLSIISGALISIGTLLLTYFTVINSSINFNFNLFFRLLPLIILFSVINAFSEGILFRNTILASLSIDMPKNLVLILSAIFFGSFHFYGAPGGVIGIVMSAFLGWYMVRSAYETKGFLSSLIIHSMQDFVIFSSLILLGNFIS